jgi:hypothetical protein
MWRAARLIEIVVRFETARLALLGCEAAQLA